MILYCLVPTNACLFNAAELLSASGTLPWPIHYMFMLHSVGQDKHFIEHFLNTKPEEGFTLVTLWENYQPVALLSSPLSLHLVSQLLFPLPQPLFVLVIFPIQVWQYSLVVGLV